MKWLLPILFLFISKLSEAQARLHIVVKQTVEVGDLFNVQYVLEGAGTLESSDPIEFPEGLGVSNGPRLTNGTSFDGSVTYKIQNISYYVTANRTGTFVIPGATIKADGKTYRCNPVTIQCVKSKEIKPAPAQRLNDAYFLAPGEDAQEKIRRNLFMKVEVNRKTCFVGEPVVATFKLYSRVSSQTNIVKNPGFYGFTVQDMVGLADKEVSEEVVNNKKFNVHTLRKVQLYPLRAGAYTIDAMEVLNNVEFSRSMINGATEQEISEGITNHDGATTAKGNISIENEMGTEPISIAVKELPSKGQPEDFSGGTGHFTIQSSLVSSTVAKNEEGTLRITVRGSGNFIQMAAPEIEWPAGLEGFAPSVNDSLDIKKTPLTGSRTFLYRFVSAKSGDYNLPSTHFSFFDPDTNSYKTVSTEPLSIRVDRREKIAQDTARYEKQREGKAMSVNPAYVWLTLIVTVVIIAAFLTWRKENRRIREAKRLEAERPKERIPLNTFLHMAAVMQGADDKTFFTALRQSIWSYFHDRFDLAGSRMSKPNLYAVMKAKNIDSTLQIELMQVLDQCETGIFTDAMTESDREALFTRTKMLLEQMDNS